MSNAFDQQNDPTPYINSVPTLSKPEPVAPKTDYADKRMKLEEERTKSVSEPEIQNLQSMQQRLEALSHKKTPVPADPKFTEPPAAPKQDFTDPIKAFQNPAVFIATLGSLFSRAPMTAALNAGGAAMEAYHKGEAEEFLQKREEWKQNLEVALEKNKIALEKYNVAWRKSDAAVKDKQAEMLAIASGEKMETMIAAIKGGHYDKVDGILEGLEKAQQKSEDSLESLKKQMFMADYRARVSTQTYEDKARLKQKIDSGLVDDETSDFMARQLIAGNVQTLTGLFQTKGAKVKIEGQARKILVDEMGMKPQEAADFMATQSNKFFGERAYQRTAGSYGARVESATNEVEQLVPQAIEASKALERTDFVPVNKLIQMWQQGISDPKYNDFITANFGLLTAYTRAMNPTGTPHVNDRLEAHAIQLLGQAVGPEAYEVQVKRLWKEVQASKKAIAETREGLKPAKDFPVKTDDGWKIERIN